MMTDDEVRAELASLKALVKALLGHLKLDEYMLLEKAKRVAAEAAATRTESDKVRAEIAADLAARTRDYKRSLGIAEDFKLAGER
jgi:hypothetical protein